MRRAIVAITLLALAACGRDGGDPRGTAIRFHDALARGDTTAATALCDLADRAIAPAQTQRLVADLGARMAAREWDFRVVDARADGDAAVVVVDECVKRGRPAFDIDAFWLLRGERGWVVLLTVSQPSESARLSAPERRERAARLATWFDERHAALTEAHAARR